MKKELRTYDPIIGLGDFDEWSYCENDQMWYEDAKEILPQPQQDSEIISDITCEIKVSHWASLWDDNWYEIEEHKDELIEFACYVIGENNSWDCTDNAFLLKTSTQMFITGFNDYGLWSLEEFIKKLKSQNYATEYFEDGGFLKFIAWTDKNNQSRFVIYSYNEEYKYLKTVFDITIDRDILIEKFENILKIWRETVYNAIKEQEQILNKKAENPKIEPSVNHFFPEFRTPVNKVIESNLKYFEREYNIKILFAIENGSRAWNMASKNSDYDVRFVFKKRVEGYLSLNKPKDVIEEYLDEEYRNCSGDKALLDIVGFDIKKYMELLAKSNPTSIEWLMSDIIYYGSNDLPIKQYVYENFNPKALIYHYISLCKKHYNRYISENKKVTHKMYLYMMRGLLNALFVYKKDSIPPLDFTKTVELLKDDIPTEIYNTVKQIIEIKGSGLEKDIIERIDILDKYIDENINKTFEVVERKFDYAILDDYIANTIMKDDIPQKVSLFRDKYSNKTSSNDCNIGVWILAILFILVLILSMLGY